MPDALVVDIGEWIEKARHDPVRYLQRQATEIILTALGTAPLIQDNVFLKGGTLMGIVYRSERQTSDLDFSTSLTPQKGVELEVVRSLDEELERAAAQLGYPGHLCKVQSKERKPRSDKFETAEFPALILRIAYALRGSAQERSFRTGNCPNIVSLDLSFKEPVYSVQLLRLGTRGATIGAYSLIELIAEKLRALLQQPIRNRFRRQDVYDISILLKQFELDQDEKARLHLAFLDKCRSRNISPDKNSLADPNVKDRANRDWDSLVLELGDLPSFDMSYATVEQFYRNLPWSNS